MVYCLIFTLACSRSTLTYGTKPHPKATINPPWRKNHQSERLVKDKDQAYPLHQAVWHNELHWVKAILIQDHLANKHKKDKSTMQVNQKDSEGYLPIHWSMDKKFSYITGSEAKKHISILNALLQYTNIQSVDCSGKTALHWAVIHNNLEAVEAILQHCKKNRSIKLPMLIHQKDQDGFSALHYAVDIDETKKCSAVALQILHTLLNYLGSNIQAQDHNGMTVLHWAAANNNLKAVEALLQHSASTMTSVAYKAFIQMPSAISPKTQEGGCPAIYWTMAPDYAKQDEQYALEKRLTIFNLLLPTYDINYQDNQGYTIAHWAAVQGCADMLKILIKKGVDLSIQDKKGCTVLDATRNTIIDAHRQKAFALIDCLTRKDGNVLSQLLSITPSIPGPSTKNTNRCRAPALTSSCRLSEKRTQPFHQKRKVQEEEPYPLRTRKLM